MRTQPINQPTTLDRSRIVHVGVLQGLGRRQSTWYLAGFSGMINEYRDQYGNRCLINPRRITQ